MGDDEFLHKSEYLIQKTKKKIEKQDEVNFIINWKNILFLL